MCARVSLSSFSNEVPDCSSRHCSARGLRPAAGHVLEVGGAALEARGDLVGDLVGTSGSSASSASQRSARSERIA